MTDLTPPPDPQPARSIFHALAVALVLASLPSQSRTKPRPSEPITHELAEFLGETMVTHIA